MSTKRLVTLREAGATSRRTLQISEEAPWEIRLLSAQGESVEYAVQGDDLFDCLVKLREAYLEPAGIEVECNGARRNVVPSRMSRQMSGGAKAYVVELGKPARRAALVDIFDCPDVATNFATVAEQREFQKRWKESL